MVTLISAFLVESVSLMDEARPRQKGCIYHRLGALTTNSALVITICEEERNPNIREE